MKITKITAAKRQLNIAIYLYFNDMDQVSVHTLAGAARNILFDLEKLSGNVNHNLMTDNIMKSDYKDMYEKIIRGAQNFFKHAGLPGDDTKQFDLTEEMTLNLLFDAISRFESFGYEISGHMKIFNSYFYLKNIDKIEDPKIKKIVEKYSTTQMTKLDFYESFRE